MGIADEHQEQKTTAGGPDLHLVFPGDAASVRDALNSAMLVFRDMGLGEELPGVVEIVLAEALNNVVEHAYSDQGGGSVELVVVREAAALAFRIRDDGVMMPGGVAPPGHAHDLDVPDTDLPEGGFGWFIIREMTRDLSYQRIADRNQLTFRIPFSADTDEA